MRCASPTACLRAFAVFFFLAAICPAAQQAPSYPGIEADAPWRTEAAERIARLRKADLKIRVLDAKGKPVKDADVSVRQQQHAFRFCCTVNPRFFLKDSQKNPAEEEDAERYRETIASLFNCVHTPPDATEAEVAAVKEWASVHQLIPPETGKTYVDVPATFTAENLIPPPALLSRLNELAKEGKPLRACRFQISVPPLASESQNLQATYLRDYLTVLFSRPEVEEIGLDGIWVLGRADAGWALYDRNWMPLPTGDAFTKLVKKQWWTDETALTNAAGECTISAFLGKYRVSVSAAGQTLTVNASVPAPKGELQLKLEATPSPATSADAP